METTPFGKQARVYFCRPKAKQWNQTVLTRVWHTPTSRLDIFDVLAKVSHGGFQEEKNANHASLNAATHCYWIIPCWSNQTICKNCSSVTLTVVREHEILKQNMQEMYRNVTLRYHGGKQTVMIDDDSDSKAPTFTCFSCFPPKYQKQILPSRDTEFACSTIISNPSIQSKTR